NYTIAYVPGGLSVTPAALSLRTLDQSKVYGTNFSFAGTEFSASGLKNGETISLVTLSSAGAAATADVAGSPYSITLSDPRGGNFDPVNYAISVTEGAFAVTPAGLTITARGQTKVYGNTLILAGTEVSSVGLLNNDA